MNKLLSKVFTAKENNENTEKFLNMDGDTFFYNRYLKSKINPFLKGRMLECCSAISTDYLEYPKYTVSVDVNYQMLKNIVNDNAPVAADIQTLPFASDTFDTVLIMHGIHHVGKDKVNYMNYIRQVILECGRVLKRDGKLIIVEGIVSHFMHLILCAGHFLFRCLNRGLYYKYDLPLLYSTRVMEKFFTKELFSLIHKDKVRVPFSLLFHCEPMFCLNVRVPLLLLPQRPIIYVLQKVEGI